MIYCPRKKEYIDEQGCQDCIYLIAKGFMMRCIYDELSKGLKEKDNITEIGNA